MFQNSQPMKMFEEENIECIVGLFAELVAHIEKSRLGKGIKTVFFMAEKVWKVNVQFACCPLILSLEGTIIHPGRIDCVQYVISKM